jgi:hypothetical protein
MTVGDKLVTQQLTVAMDPRVKTSTADLRLQFALAMRVVELMGRSKSAELGRLLSVIEGADLAPTPQMVDAVRRLDRPGGLSY